MTANLRKLCHCFSLDDFNPQTSQQELFWQREQAVHTLSAFSVQGLDKKKPSEQFDPHGEQIFKSFLTHKLVKSGSFRMLALKTNSPSPQERGLHSPGLHNSKGGL
jgi:hypothetical protein